MKAANFKVWFGQLSELNQKQQDQVKLYLTQEVQTSEVIKVLEDFKSPCCPVCKQTHFYRWGYQAGLQRYRCRNCKHTFTTLSETPLAHLRLKEQWLNYCSGMIQGLTVRANAQKCNIDKNTSFRWRHRFLQCPAVTKATRMQGIVEADETFFPYSCKGQRNLDRPARKRGKQIHTRGTGKDQVPVLVVRDRTGATADFKLAADNAAAVKLPLKNLLAKDALLCSDGSPIYKAVAKELNITHRPINLAAGIRIIANVYHIQNVNAYDSRLKGWMQRFHGVATKYLENYLGWRRWLERWGNYNSPKIGLQTALGREPKFQLLTQT